MAGIERLACKICLCLPFDIYIIYIWLSFNLQKFEQLEFTHIIQSLVFSPTCWFKFEFLDTSNKEAKNSSASPLHLGGQDHRPQRRSTQHHPNRGLWEIGTCGERFRGPTETLNCSKWVNTNCKCAMLWLLALRASNCLISDREVENPSLWRYTWSAPAQLPRSFLDPICPV